MATINVTVPVIWEKVVDAGLDFILTLNTPNFNYVEVAVSDIEVEPTVRGHQCKGPEQGLTRALVGPGYVYARSMAGTPVIATVTAWTPA